MRIALLEDDPALAEVVALWLETAGYACARYGTGSEFRSAVRPGQHDLAIVDRVLPDDDGIEATRWFRANVSARVPVLFASALGTETEIVSALDAGADDYLVKPLRREELLARVRALFRRASPDTNNPLVCGDIELDSANRWASVGGRKVILTAREFDLAVHLFANRGRLVSRAELLREVWRTGEGSPETRTVDAHASRLRQKLGLVAGGKCELEAVYKQGYRLVAADSAPPEG